MARLRASFGSVPQGSVTPGAEQFLGLDTSGFDGWWSACHVLVLVSHMGSGGMAKERRMHSYVQVLLGGAGVGWGHWWFWKQLSDVLKPALIATAPETGKCFWLSHLQLFRLLNLVFGFGGLGRQMHFFFLLLSLPIPFKFLLWCYVKAENPLWSWRSWEFAHWGCRGLGRTSLKKKYVEACDPMVAEHGRRYLSKACCGGKDVLGEGAETHKECKEAAWGDMQFPGIWQRGRRCCAAAANLLEQVCRGKVPAAIPCAAWQLVLGKWQVWGVKGSKKRGEEGRERGRESQEKEQCDKKRGNPPAKVAVSVYLTSVSTARRFWTAA